MRVSRPIPGPCTGVATSMAKNIYLTVRQVSESWWLRASLYHLRPIPGAGRSFALNRKPVLKRVTSKNDPTTAHKNLQVGRRCEGAWVICLALVPSTPTATNPCPKRVLRGVSPTCCGNSGVSLSRGIESISSVNVKEKPWLKRLSSSLSMISMGPP